MHSGQDKINDLDEDIDGLTSRVGTLEDGGSSTTENPSAPQLSGTANSDTEIALSWTPSEHPAGMAQYWIYQNGALTPTYITGDTINVDAAGNITPDFNVTGLTAATDYTFTVRGVSTTSKLSPFSNEISVTTNAAGGALPVVGTFTASLSDNDLALNITALNATNTPTAFIVTVNDPSQPIDSDPNWDSNTNWINGILDRVAYASAYGVQQTFRAWAKNSEGISAAANVITDTTNDTIAPTAPANVVLNGTPTATSVPLSWDASVDNGTGVVGYNIYNAADDSLVGVIGNQLSGSATGLTAETTYNFYVKAVDGAGSESAASANTADITTAALPPPGSDDWLVRMNWQGDINLWPTDRMLMNGAAALGFPADEVAGGFRFLPNGSANVSETIVSQTTWGTVYNRGVISPPNTSFSSFSDISTNLTELTDGTVVNINDPVGTRVWKKTIKAPGGSQEDWCRFDSATYRTLWICFMLKIPSNWQINGSGWPDNWTNWKWLVVGPQDNHQNFRGTFMIKLHSGTNKQNADIELSFTDSGGVASIKDSASDWITPADAGTWRAMALGGFMDPTNGYVQVWSKNAGAAWTKQLEHTGIQVGESDGLYKWFGLFNEYQDGYGRPNAANNMFWLFKDLCILDSKPSFIP